jgi:hypothetical protein
MAELLDSIRFVAYLFRIRSLNGTGTPRQAPE